MRYKSGGFPVLAFWSLLGAVQSQQPLATVHLIGVQHAPGQLLYEAMSPAHVRVALSAIAPDVVCLESAPEWFAAGHFYRETYEAECIGLPWAKARGLPVAGVDWVGNEPSASERERVARVERERTDLSSPTIDARRFSYGAASQSQLRIVGPAAECDFVWINSPEMAKQSVERLDARRDEKGSAQEYIARRNAHIADEIATIAKAHTGKRLAVVIGAEHLGDLQRLLPARDLAVASTPNLATLPVDDEGLAPEDLAAIVTHAIDNGRGLTPQSARLTSLRNRLRVVAATPEATDTTRVLADYAEARFAMLHGNREDAGRAFAQLVATGAAVRFPYRGHEWRLYLTVGQAARLELGRLADLAGRRSEAIAAYQALASSLPPANFDRDYHADFEFVARAHNAVRALLETPFTAAMAFASVSRTEGTSTPTGASEATVAAMRRAWDYHRAKDWRALRTAVAAIDRESLYEVDRLELDFHLAAASVGLGEREDATTRLDALSEGSHWLGKDHWLPRQLPELRKLLK